MIQEKTKKLYKSSKFIDLVVGSGALLATAATAHILSTPAMQVVFVASAVSFFPFILLSLVNSGIAGSLRILSYKKALNKDASKHLKAIGFLLEKDKLTPQEVEYVQNTYITYRTINTALKLSGKFDTEYDFSYIYNGINTKSLEVMAKHEVRMSEQETAKKIATQLSGNYKIKISNIINLIRSQHKKENNNYYLIEELAKLCTPFSPKEYQPFVDFTRYEFTSDTNKTQAIESLIDGLSAKQVSFLKLKSMALEIADYGPRALQRINAKISSQEHLHQSQEYVNAVVNESLEKLETSKTKEDKTSPTTLEQEDLILQGLQSVQDTKQDLNEQWSKLIEAYENLTQKIAHSQAANVNKSKVKVDIQGMIPQLIAFERQLGLVQNENARQSMTNNLKSMIEQVTQVLVDQSAKMDADLSREMKIHSKYLRQKA